MISSERPANLGKRVAQFFGWGSLACPLLAKVPFDRQANFPGGGQLKRVLSETLLFELHRYRLETGEPEDARCKDRAEKRHSDRH
jgi:hypothetical protein